MSVPSPGSADAAGSNVLRNLILEPFRSARQRGKVDWHQMHLGVLKNKILDSTHREFDEKRWGFETFGELVATLSDDIHLLFPDKRPPIAELTDSARKEIEQAGPVPAEQRLPERLRVDLWNAVMDYSSGREYVWDPNAEMARVADSTESGLLPMPTVRPAEMETWRRDFFQLESERTAEGLRPVLDDWLARSIPSTALPGALRQHWNAFLRTQVFQHLDQWAAENSIALPRDSRATAAPSRKAGAEVELRAYIRRCVDAMSVEELQSLLLPARAAQRAGGR